jgi:hypothetical protein
MGKLTKYVSYSVMVRTLGVLAALIIAGMYYHS